MYALPGLIVWGASVFLRLLRSRRALEGDRETHSQALANLNAFSPVALPAVPCPRTLGNVLARLPVAALAGLLVQVIRTLIRAKVLDGSRLFGELTIAVDATETWQFKRPHCPHCLRQTRSDGTVRYYHAVLLACIVTPSGLTLPVVWEQIANEPGRDYDKQDCETKAFARLLARLRQHFPLLSITLLLDGLYPNRTIFGLAAQHRCSMLITLKDDQLPTLQADIRRRLVAYPDQACRYRLARRRRHGTVRWVTDLHYAGFTLHYLTCRETDERTGRVRTFAWVTDLRPTAANAVALATGARQRWRIENEAFNVLKNGGYRLKHCFGATGRAADNWLALCLLAFTWHQLLLHGDLLRKLAGSAGSQAQPPTDQPAFFRWLCQSLAGFAERFRAAWHYQRDWAAALLTLGHFQIRYSSA